MAQVTPAKRLAAELARAAEQSPNALVWIDGAALNFGAYPVVTLTFDFATEKLVSPRGQAPAPIPVTDFDTVGGRNTGVVVLELLGQTYRFTSRKALLLGALKLIEMARPGTLQQLETVKARTKRIVAHKPDLLYEDRKLVQKFTAELMPGWFVATNNSTAEVEKYLRKAAEFAQLKWGAEVRVVWEF